MTASPSPSQSASASPSPSLLEYLRVELRRSEPFARLRGRTLDELVGGARQTYYAAGEIVLDPASGVVQRLCWIRRGAVAGRGADAVNFHCAAGELFPIGAVLGARAVSSSYTAVDDLFCVEFDTALVLRLVADDPVLADFMNRRVQHLLEVSRRTLQLAFAARTLDEQSFEADLASLPRRTPLGVGPETALRTALALMHERRVGSILALDPAGAALGIVTERDLLARIVLADPPLDLLHTPLTAVMSQPVHTLDIAARVHDAALLMARHAIRHVPITEAGRVVGVVSERDLFALQRLSLKTLSASLREAADANALRPLAASIREFARHLLAQGLAARTLTGLVSHLNDLLTQRLVELLAARHGLHLERACWLAFGSEGRSEQTIATDQDNGLVLADEVRADEHAAWLHMAREVNQRLDDCGYPLCKGGVMAGNADCCLRQQAWLRRFGAWIDQGEPEDVLKASIFFDLRALAGNVGLAVPLRERIVSASAVPRFIHQLAQNALRSSPALHWHGGLKFDSDSDTDPASGGTGIDLKLRGSAIFVEAARLFALATGVDATGTRERLEAAGARLGARPQESEGWVTAFEFIQTLRLRNQVGENGAGGAGGMSAGNPNRIDVAALNDVDRRLLKDALGVARRLQQRIELDWMRS